jgi:rod shape-determining protein MreD
MIKKLLFTFLLFYILVVFQTSFLISFSIKEQIPNLVLIALFLIIFLGKEMSSSFPIESFLAGFFLDLFSSKTFGLSIVILVAITFLLKKILRELRVDNFISFAFLFLIFLIDYEILIGVLDFLILKEQMPFNFWLTYVNPALIRISYTFIFGLIIFACLKYLRVLKTKR